MKEIIEKLETNMEAQFEITEYLFLELDNLSPLILAKRIQALRKLIKIEKKLLEALKNG